MMGNKEKIKVTMAAPGMDKKTYEADYIMASLFTDNANGDSSKIGISTISYGDITAGNYLRAWSLSLIDIIKGLEEDAKKRSVLYAFAENELMNMIQRQDPDVLGASGELRVRELFMNLLRSIDKK